MPQQSWNQPMAPVGVSGGNNRSAEWAGGLAKAPTDDGPRGRAEQSRFAGVGDRRVRKRARIRFPGVAFITFAWEPQRRGLCRKQYGLGGGRLGPVAPIDRVFRKGRSYIRLFER